ncbi:MAG TPA: Gfo/Idh/MocA family oxidoreductase, partial [Chitinophagaceae bacterium]|nr:Gfo/Idh/MocA family oxidoreductase [Chitinophagaceae bacterium]
MPTPIRWGILGPGHIAEKFAEALNHTGGVLLEAVASRDPERAAAFAGKFGGCRYHADYISLAEDPSVDVIYIATPHGFHLEHALLCLERGKPLLIEKPMTLSWAGTSKLTGMALQKGLFVMEAMWTRFLPVIRTTERLIKEGEIGDLRMVLADFCFKGTSSREGRLYNMRLGGGSLLDVGVYPLSLFQLFLGNPEKILSCARLADTGADEICQALLQYPAERSAQMISGI